MRRITVTVAIVLCFGATLFVVVHKVVESGDAYAAANQYVLASAAVRNEVGEPRTTSLAWFENASFVEGDWTGVADFAVIVAGDHGMTKVIMQMKKSALGWRVERGEVMPNPAFQRTALPPLN